MSLDGEAIKRNDIFSGIKKFFSSPEAFYRFGAKVVTKTIYRTKFIDMHHIPETGPAILICNHISYMDGMLIHTACPRPVKFIIDADIYNVPAVKYWMDYCGAIPISPNRKSVNEALDAVSEAMKNGELVCIFPEGYLTYTGNMIRFRFGVEWMVKRDNVEVIPLAIKGLWGSIFSRKYLHSRFPWMPRSLFRKVTVKCGKPVPPEKAKVNHLQRVVMKLKSSI